MAGRAWTPQELAILRREYGCMPTAKLSAALHRSPSAVHQRARIIGKAKPHAPLAQCEALIRTKHAAGWCDTDIAQTLGCHRWSIRNLRKQWGLPSNSRNHRWRERIIAASRKQCREAGVKNLGELRALVFRQRAAATGWPVDLWPREVEILGLLESGGQTRKELCAAMGLPWRGARRSMKSRRPGGTHLAYLVRRGLVKSRRVYRSAWRSGFEAVYELAPGVRRREIA